MSQRDQALQLHAGLAEQVDQLGHEDGLRLDAGPQRRFLTSFEVVAEYGWPNIEALRKWAGRHGVVPLHRGRRLVYDRRDIEIKLRAFRHRSSLRRSAA